MESAGARARVGVMGKRVTVIGAGWAGCTAAVAAHQAGHQVTLLEAARTVGGRARSVPYDHQPLDNGQHIMLGAYTACLHWMQVVGVQPEQAFQRLPLDLRYPTGHGLRMPKSSAWPHWDVLRAIVGARGWRWRDKASLLRHALHWQSRGFVLPGDTSVAALCHRLSRTVYQQLIVPLCVSAFNSAPEHTSAQVFLRVLHDALLSQHGGADVLLARRLLGEVYPEAAQTWLQQHGAQIHTGTHVAHIEPQDQGWQWHSTTKDGYADVLILACPAWEAARLVEAYQPQWAARAIALEHMPIATVYASCPAEQCAHLPPMQALPDNIHHPAQFVFRHPAHNGVALLAFVCSLPSMERSELQEAVLMQAHTQLGLTALTPLQTTVEKRATFVCSPSLQRPAAVLSSNLLACGDYVAGNYPATLEGAVRSGAAVVTHL